MSFTFLMRNEFYMHIPEYVIQENASCLSFLAFSLRVSARRIRNNSLASEITMNFLSTKNKELNQDDIILLVVNFHSGENI